MFRSTIPALFTAALLTVPALAQDHIAGKTIKQDPADAPAVAAKPGAKPSAKPDSKTADAAKAEGTTQSWQMDADLPQGKPGTKTDSKTADAAKAVDTPQSWQIEAKAVAQDATQPWQTDADLPQGKPGAGGIVGLAYLELTADKDMLTAFVHGSEPGFMGIVLLSSSPDQRHYLVGLPPLLADFAVMGVGFAKGSQDLWLSVPASKRLAEIKVYGQALTLDSTGLSVSGIVQLGAQ